PQPSEVLDHLMHTAPAAHERICLSGNHEKSLLRYLEEPEFLMRWSRFGGLDTLSAYGVEVDQPLTEEACRTAQHKFAANFPADQKSFLETLPLSVSFGDYFFAHAGVRPGIPLEEQDPHDLVWIRHEFLESRIEHGKLVVHGHTPNDDPEIRPNRINIDTAAFATGVLTCLILEDDRQSLMATG
ncbi:MAG: serine/threonine protein phosphatase, partial [Pseudomonadota bacterium]